jgi:hypothetical protein
MKHDEKRKEFLIKQGYSREMIDLLSSYGVKRHMLWFLRELKHSHKKEIIEISSTIKLINDHIERSGKNKFKTIHEAIMSASAERSRMNGLENVAIHRFEDGHFITYIPYSELSNEAVVMSNCVGNYVTGVKEKERAILALKSPDGDTLVHFEILKNGLISQHFEKANMPVRPKYWRYIAEFLKANSKKIDSNKHFGFGWQFHMSSPKLKSIRGGHSEGSYVDATVNCVIPKKISKSITNEGFVSEIELCDNVKTFKHKIPSLHYSGLDKGELIKKLRNFRSEMSKSIDEIISNVESTDGEDMFLSDELKEKIFGKGCYLMNGDDYGIMDMTMFLSGNIDVVDEPRAQGLMGRPNAGRDVAVEEEIPMIEVPEVDEPARRPHILIHNDQVEAERQGDIFEHITDDDNYKDICAEEEGDEVADFKEENRPDATTL